MNEESCEGFKGEVVEMLEDNQALLEVEFEFVCQKDNLIFLGNRK